VVGFIEDHGSSQLFSTGSEHWLMVFSAPARAPAPVVFNTGSSTGSVVFSTGSSTGSVVFSATRALAHFNTGSRTIVGD